MSATADLPDRWVLRGAEVLDEAVWVERDLVIDGDRVVEGPAAPGDRVVDGAGSRAVPGWIDLQCNGGLGFDLASDPGAIWALGAELPRWGVTAWLPTIVTAPEGTIDAARAVLAAGPPAGWRGAIPLGLHLEGPFLSGPRRGAHVRSLLREPTPAAIDGWAPETGVRLVTLAPELPGALEVIEALAGRGVVVSLGHTEADAATARAGLDAGATWVTHLFNAMEPMRHREPGLVGVALTDPRVHVGLIADGVHVDPAVVAVAQASLGERLTLVTDAVGALGMPDGPERLGTGEVVVTGDAVRLRDGTLAGSNLSMDRAVRNLVAFTDGRATLADACRAAATAPARMLGESDRGALRAGARADVVLLDHRGAVRAAVVGGRVVAGSI